MKKRHLLSVAVLFSSMLGFAQNSLSMNDVTLAPGESAQVSVNLTNATPYTAFQFDMTLPEGITVEDVTLNSERADDHILKKGIVNGKYRVLAYSYNDVTKEGNKPFKGSEGAIVNLTLKAGSSIAEGATIVIDAGNAEQEGGQVFVEANGTTNYEMGEVTAAVTVNTTELVKITSAKQAVFCSSKNLDFTSVAAVKAYIVTGYDKVSGTIWLTRVFDVPAETAVLLMGEAGEYPIPTVSESKSYYKNLLKGSLTATTITKVGENGMTNYILSKVNDEVGFYFAKEDGSSVKPGGGYLPLPTTINPAGTAGSEESIPMNKYGMKGYCSEQSLDFTNVADLKAYVATGYDKTGTVTLTRLMQVPANTGMLLLAPKEAKSYTVPTTSVQQYYANMLTGTTTGENIKQVEGDIVNYYVSVKNNEAGYYWASASGTDIPKNNSWLSVPKYMTSLAASTRGSSDISDRLSISLADEIISMKVINFSGEDDGTTGISRIASEAGNDTWYNLKGQRIDTPTKKGLYIKNGKKVIVK